MASRVPLLSASNLRTDSRLPLEIRSLSFQILPAPPATATSLTIPPGNADGYASVSHGLTRVAASVWGPREPLRTGPFSNTGGALRNTELASVNVEVGLPGWDERTMSDFEPGVKKTGKDRRTVELASAIKSTFEPVILLHLYPRASIDIYIQIFHVDGSLLQAAINVTTLALISAGIPLKDYVCALSLASYPSSSALHPQEPPFELLTAVQAHSNSSKGHIGTGSTIIVDVTSMEENALPNLTVAVLPRTGQISFVGLESRVGVARFEEMMRWGLEGCKVTHKAMENTVKEWAKNLAAPAENLGVLPSSKGRDEEIMSE